MFNKLDKKNKIARGTPSFGILADSISNENCKELIEWIITSNYEPDDSKPSVLNILINSPGGDISAAFSLIEIIEASSIPVRTIALGQISSAALMIFISGHKGLRTLTKNTSILSHQWSSQAEGKEHELVAAMREYELTTKRMIAHYKAYSSLSEKDIRKILLPPQDVWLNVNEALKYGLADLVSTLK